MNKYYENSAIIQHCTLKEMFCIEQVNQNGCYAIKLISEVGDSLKFAEVYINNEYIELDSISGLYITQISKEEVTNIRLRYLINGVDMTTDYKATDLLDESSSISHFKSQGGRDVEYVIGRNTVRFSKKVDYTVYHINGGVLVKSYGEEVDLYTLHPGLYIVQFKLSDCAPYCIKIRR